MENTEKRVKKYLALLPIFIFSVLLGYSLLANAVSKDDIVFPVAELGGCENQEECREYCDEPENITACVSFAEQHNLMSKDEAERARRFASVGNIGPGGCNSKETCEAYCENIDNIEVCLKFAEDNHMLPDNELQEARNVHRILKEGKKFPGNCRGKSQCTAYCENPDHMEECIAFGEESGLMPPEELEKAKKFIPLMKRGETPGGCRNKEQCEEYCLQEDHIDQCADFALKVGAATKEEMEMFKKTRGRGPGDCRGREECESFCNDPANQEACFKFAEEHGFIEKGQHEEIRGHQERLKNEFSNFPPEVLECIKSKMGTEVVDKIRAGTLTPGPEIGKHIQACFENFKPQMDMMKSDMMKDGMPPPGMEGEFRPDHGSTSPEYQDYQHDQNYQQDQNYQNGQNECPQIIDPVCTIYGSDQDHTFTNECFARSQGATIKYKGECRGDYMCSNTADPVCGSDGKTYFHPCEAQRVGVSIQYKGSCGSNNYPTHTDYPIPQPCPTGSFWDELRQQCILKIEPQPSPSPYPDYPSGTQGVAPYRNPYMASILQLLFKVFRPAR